MVQLDLLTLSGIPKPIKVAGNNWFYVALMEGRNREVRRLWESQGLQVNRLKAYATDVSSCRRF